MEARLTDIKHRLVEAKEQVSEIEAERNAVANARQRLTHVRFTPESGHEESPVECLLWVKSGHRPLPQRDDQPVEVGGNNQPDLAARQRQPRAVLVG
jgi:hypothetical protein